MARLAPRTFPHPASKWLNNDLNRDQVNEARPPVLGVTE